MDFPARIKRIATLLDFQQPVDEHDPLEVVAAELYRDYQQADREGLTLEEFRAQVRLSEEIAQAVAADTQEEP